MASSPIPDDRAALAASLAAAALVAQQVAGKAVRDALFLSHFPVEQLPATLMASATLGAVAVLAFSRLVTRLGPGRTVAGAVAAATLAFLGEWALSASHPRLAALAVYAHMAALGGTLLSSFWSLVNERFDPYAARRVVGRIGLGASLGGVLGGALAWALSGRVAVPSLLLVLAGINLLCLPAVWWLGLRGTQAQAPPPEPAGSGLALLRRSPYLRHLALLVALGGLAEATLDYALNAQAAGAFRSSAGLVAFFALFHGGVALLALGVQVFGTRRALETFGLAGSAALKPATVTLTSVAGLLAPQLWTAALARGLEAVLHNSVYRAGYELLFTPLPQERKRPTKPIVDVAFDRLGTLAGGSLALLAVAVAPSLAPRALFAVAALAGFAGLALCRRAHAGYVLALEESLRSGAVRLDPGEIMDSTTRLTLARTGLILDRDTLVRQIQALRDETVAGSPPATGTAGPSPAGDALLAAAAALRSGDTAAVQAALGRELEPPLVGLAIPLLARNDVFLEALDALRRAAPRAAGQLADALLDPAQPSAVRRRLPRVLRSCPTQRAADGLRAGLGDAEFEVRYECGAALARIAERNPELELPPRAVYAAALRELREAGGLDEEARHRLLQHVFHLLSLVLEKEPVRIAHQALRGSGALRGTALEYLENVLPGEVRDALWAVLGVSESGKRSARGPQDLVSELLRMAGRSE